MSELKTNLQSILQEKTTKIIPQNIKKDVEVLDVTGSYDKEDIKELQDELADAEQELADVRRDLDNSTATVSGSGENITLNGTAEARFKKAPLPLGNTEQEVIEAQAGTTVEGESILASGIDLNKVEILNINGNTKQQTTTGTNLIGLDTNQYKVNLSAGDKLTITNNTAEEAIIDLYSNYGDTQRNDWFSFAANSVRTVTLVNDAKAIAWRNAINGIAWCNLGETATSYEPYTGGEVSPNPDYPQEIHSAGANMNLFDKQNATSKIGYIKDDNGNEIPTGGFSYTTSYIKVNPNTTYTLSGKLVNNNGTARTYYYDKNKNWISRSTGFGVNVNVCTFITPQNCNYIQFQYINEAFDIDTIKLEKGSKATLYSKYNQGNMNIEISNKNLFDGLFELGTIDSLGVKQNSSTAIRTVNFIPINPNTQYILSSEATQIRSVFYDENYQFVGTHPASFTSKENEYYMKFVLSSTDLQTEAQLEQGSTATTYVAHEGQSFIVPTQAPFRKIGDYKDTFVKKVDGKWYEKHEIGEVILDGSENNWSKSGNTTFDRFILGTNISGIVAQGGYSNYFKVATINVSNNLHEMSNNGNSQLVFNYSTYGNTTLEQFKTWLSTHNVIVNYVLETPTYIECTQEQSDILDQINTFYETTNIFSTDEVSPNFTFTYNKVYASPSPDDESPIQTVSGDVEVKVQNKNLFNKDNIKTIDYYIQPIAPNPGEHIYSLNNRNCEIEVEPNTDYIRNIVKVNNMTFWSSITFYDKDHAFISGLWSPDNIITTPSNAKYMILSTSGNVSSLFGDELVLETYYNSLQLEKGTTLTNYVEHKEQALPLALKSKNLFDGEIELGSINPGNGELQPSTTRTRSKNFLKVKPNTTYTMSVQTGQFRWIIGYTADKIGITDGNTSGQPSAISTFPVSTVKTNTFTTTATTEYIKWYDTSSTDLTEKVQIEEGSTATSYKPYYNYELCKIENYQDYFWKNETTNKWYLHKETEKIILDGVNKTLLYHMLANAIHCGYINLATSIVKPSTNDVEIKTKSNSFISNSINYLINAKEIGVGVRADGLVFFSFGENTTLTSSELISQWLQNNNLIFNYPLETSTDTEITNTALISQLEAIRKAISYDEQTNVSSNTIALFDVIALRNMNTILNTLENDVDLLE